MFKLALQAALVFFISGIYLPISAVSANLPLSTGKSGERAPVTTQAIHGDNNRPEIAPLGPVLSVNLRKIDLGTALIGDKITGQIMIRNTGTGVLRWTAAVPATPPLTALEIANEGRFISFQNRDVAATGIYLPPAHIRAHIEVTGKWSEEEGYPLGLPPAATLRFRFSGTAIRLVNLRKSDEGALAVLIDDQPILFPIEPEEGSGYLDRQMIKGLPDTQHTLAIISRDARIIMEGVQTFGRGSLRFPAGVVKVFPRSGITTRETDYLTITVDTRNLNPGLYLEYLELSSNAGPDWVLMYLDVFPAGLTKLLEVYRYVKDSKYLFTANLQADSKKIFAGSYEKQGIAFQLFPPDTPGTTEFLRWHNPHTGDYFYSYQRQGGGKALSGYILEGPIGNIATSRISGTRPLHRWLNKKTGRHFFTVDSKGEDINKQGYSYDGISGFVR